MVKALWNTHYEYWWKICKPKYIHKSNQSNNYKEHTSSEKKLSCSMCGEFVREKRKGPSRGVHCLQPVQISSEHAGVSGSHIQVLEGIDLILKNKILH